LAASDVLGTGWFAADAADGYRVMHERRATKVLFTP
jgi:hypothetical protein